MARRRVFVHSIDGDSVSVEGARAHHLHRVARLRRGELVEVSDTKRIFLAAVTRSSSSRVELEVRDELALPEPAAAVTVGLSIFRFSRLEWVLEKATELGVSAILPIAAARSHPGLVQAAAKRHSRWCKIAEEAASQSRRPAPPRVAKPVSFAQALSEIQADPRLLLDTDSPLMKDVMKEGAPEGPASPAAALLIGPEGGWTGEERQAARQAGYRAVSLGPTILRTETAAMAAIAVLSHWLR